MIGYLQSHGKEMAWLSAQILRARKEKRVTQADMAKRLGMNRHTYAKREERPELMTLQELYMVSDLLGIRAEDLIR